MSPFNSISIPPWRIGLRALRANLIPALFLQSVAVIGVIAYYRLPAVHQFLGHLARLQEGGGIYFSILLRVVFNACVPALFCACIPHLRQNRPWRTWLVTTCFWGWMGMSTHLFYTLQVILWGDIPHWGTVLCKTATDMLLYSPFYASPLASLVHVWLAEDCKWKRLRHQMGKGWYRRLVLPNQITGWGFWVPGVMIIYSLPFLLEIPVATLMSCFWSLMCLQIAHHTPRSIVSESSQ